MKKYLYGVSVLPFLSAVAFAGQPLSDSQMDQVTAGFASAATAAAASQGGVILANTATLAEVAGYADLVFQERTLHIIKSVAASQSVSSAFSLPTNNVVPGVSPPAGGG
jgi:hypothetical protein